MPLYYDYSMENRTYRYFQGTPLYPFGHGLSYTQFEYGPIEADQPAVTADGVFTISFELANSGTVDGDEVVQLYVRHLESALRQPRHSLAGFQRVHLKQGEHKTLRLVLSPGALRYWDEEQQDYVVGPGPFEVQVGASSSDIRRTIQLAVK